MFIEHAINWYLRVIIYSKFFNNSLFILKSCIDSNVQYMYIYIVYNLWFNSFVALTVYMYV